MDFYAFKNHVQRISAMTNQLKKTNTNLSSEQLKMADALLKPETALESSIIRDASFGIGLFWGEPRYGHPEGNVIYHIKEVFDNIDLLEITKEERAELRLVALIHDTFKYKEAVYRKNNNYQSAYHHATLAKNFAQKYLDNKRVVNLIQFHDDAYFAWRKCLKPETEAIGLLQLEALKYIFKGELQFYYHFFICDTRTGNKNQAPVKWVEEQLEGLISPC